MRWSSLNVIVGLLARSRRRCAQIASGRRSRVDRASFHWALTSSKWDEGGTRCTRVGALRRDKIGRRRRVEVDPMLRTRELRSVLDVLRTCAEADDSEDFRAVVLRSIHEHLGYDRLTFFLGRHPAAQLALRDPVVVGVPGALMDRYLERYAPDDVFAADHARGLLRLHGMACLPEVLDAALAPAQDEYASTFLGASGITDKVMVWFDTELPVHGFLGVLAVGDREFDDRDRAVMNELRPHLTFMLRSRLRQTSNLDAGPLTIRQHQVARLVADGWSNRAIARHLDVGEWTVKKHVTHVLTKLGVRSRTELAVLWRESDTARTAVQG
jgi:DNA-binding CsgD family transcriptional regulator